MAVKDNVVLRFCLRFKDFLELQNQKVWNFERGHAQPSKSASISYHRYKNRPFACMTLCQLWKMIKCWASSRAVGQTKATQAWLVAITLVVYSLCNLQSSLANAVFVAQLILTGFTACSSHVTRLLCSLQKWVRSVAGSLPSFWVSTCGI